MSIESCFICVSKGVICEKPYVPGEAKAKIVRKGLRQGISLEPIEKCAKRCQVLDELIPMRRR